MPAAQRLLRALLIGVASVAVVTPASAALAAPPPATLQQQIDQKSAALEQIVEQYNKIGEQLKASKAEADQLESQMGPLLAHLDSASAAVNQIAVNAYKGGGVSTMGALLTSGSPATLIDELGSLNQIARPARRAGDTDLRRAAGAVPGAPEGADRPASPAGGPAAATGRPEDHHRGRSEQAVRPAPPGVRQRHGHTNRTVRTPATAAVRTRCGGHRRQVRVLGARAPLRVVR